MVESTVDEYQNLIDVFEQHIKEAESHTIKARRDLTIAEAQHRAWTEALEILQSAFPENTADTQSIAAELANINNIAVEAMKKHKV